MKAVTYQGIKDVRVKEVKAPEIKKTDDIIVKLTTTAICGSDLHLIHGMVPNFPEDYIIGHEPMGIVEETGPDVHKVKKAIVSSYRLTSAAANVFSAKTSLKANVTIQMQTAKSVLILAIQTQQAAIPEARLNTCASPMLTSLPLNFLMTVK